MVASVGLIAVDLHRADLVGILLEIGEAEDAERARIGGDLLDQQIVVLARFDERAVLADLGADLLVLVLVGLLERLHRRVARRSPWSGRARPGCRACPRSAAGRARGS